MIRLDGMREWIRKNEFTCGVAVLALAVFVLVRRWFVIFMIWPDSSIYLTAAMNFVRHGTLFIYTNYPSASLLPQTEVYADYPPGFPLYLSFFYFFVRDAIAAAVGAQAVALGGFLLAIYFSARALRLSLPWLVAALYYFLYFVSFRIIFASLLTEALYIALSLAVFLCSLALLENPRRKWLWAGAYGALFLSACIRWNGIANGIFLLFPIFAQARAVGWGWTGLRLLGAGLAAASPNPIWFFRNSFYLNKGTAMHDVSHIPKINWEKLGVPFENMALRFGFGHFWIFLLVLAFALSPYFFRRARIQVSAYWMLVAGMLTQFLVIYLLTLVFTVTNLDDRYLSPAYTFFGLLLIYAAGAYLRDWALWNRWAPALALAGAVLLPILEFSLPSKASGWHVHLNRPAEHLLWREISSWPEVVKATHYYTGDNFLHQLFAEKPHRMLSGTKPADAETIRATGPNFFFIASPSTGADEFINRYFAGLRRREVAGFFVYTPKE